MPAGFRNARILGLMAGLALAPGCSRPLSFQAIGGPSLVRPSIVDTRGSLPVDAGLGTLVGARASTGIGHAWALHTEALAANGRFASTELPTDTPVRLTVLALPVTAGYTPGRNGRVELLVGLQPSFPVRARRAFRDQDQDILDNFRSADLSVVLDAGLWLESGHRLRVDFRYVAGVTNLDTTGWYELRRQSFELVLAYRVWHRN